MLDTQFVCMDLKANSAEEAIRTLCGKLVETGAVDKQYEAAVLQREKIYPTGLPTPGYPLALPHAANDHVRQSAIAVGRLEKPVQFFSMAMDDELLPVRLVLLLAIDDPNQQLDLLQNLVTAIQEEETLQALENAESCEAQAQLLRKVGLLQKKESAS